METRSKEVSLEMYYFFVEMYTPSEVETNFAIVGNITFTTKKRIYFHFFLSVTSEILVSFTCMEIFKANFFSLETIGFVVISE